MGKIEILLIGAFILLLFKLIKELAYISLYSFILKLQSEGKLVPENDPYGVVKKTEENLKKNASKYF
ncbi:MAG: hypothetical protein QM534_03085 [Sediminibacterium sp.]|nr:hypothetical protein [Sediminibacterium sp.]